jgi:hypothetical protein
MANAPAPNLQIHPILANLNPSDSVIELSGYIGPASSGGRVRLYHSLHDLSHYIEFDKAQVLSSSPASKNIAPNNGVTLWVKSSAPVHWVREFRTARHLARQVVKMTNNPASQPPGVY